MAGDLKMCEELPEVLNRCRERFVEELDVSVTFLAKLVSRGIIQEEHKKIIDSKNTPHSKVDELISILVKRDDTIKDKFYSVLENENSDLAEHFLQQKACIEPRKNNNVYQNYDEIDLKNCQTDDIIEGFKEVQRKGTDLEDCIDPENGLLTRLSNQAIIDYADIEILEKIKPFQLLNGKLLGIIRININSISNKFIEALCQDEQDHIAKFIVTAGCKTNSVERLLPREWRKVIDDNMFCLDKLIDTEKHDLVLKLAAGNCIRTRHRDRVIHSKPENKAHELLIILQRRRYKDFFNFMECLRKEMRNNIVKILEKGGVTEIKVQLFQERRDKKNIEAELIRKLTGYVDEDKSSELSEDQRKFVDALLAELAEHDIRFIGACPGTSMGSLSMFLQGGKEDSLQVLNDGCESGSLKDKLETGFRFLLEIPDNEPPLVKEVTTGQHSNRHHVTTETEHYSGCRSEVLQDENNGDDDDCDDDVEKEEGEGGEKEEKEDGEKDEEEWKEDDNIPEEEKEERNELRSINTNKRLRESKKQEIARHRRETSVNAEQPGTNLAKLRNEINDLKNKCCSKLTARCYQLKLHRTTDVDDEEVIRDFNGSEIVQPVLGNIKMIEDQWRRLDLLEILHSVNPSHLMEFGRNEPFKHNSTSLGNKEDMTFRWSIVLCGIFENLMQTLGWKVGDTLHIEDDICDVVGQLLMRVEKQDRSSLLDCMQSAMVNIQVEDRQQVDDKLRTLLITEKKYNGLNLACILLEQMIIDNKDNNTSWMRTVCAQFIDLVVQLIIEPEYRVDVHWTLTYLLNLESEWKVVDVYNLMKNGLLMFHSDQNIFHRYLMIIRNSALHPSLNISPTKRKKAVELKDILYSRDKNKWSCLNEVVCGEETEKSVNQVILKLKEWEIGQAEKDTILQIISNSQAMLKKYKYFYFRTFRRYILRRELDRIRKSEQKNDVDVLSSCLAVTSMALHTCKKYWPLNTQLVSYCLLVTQRENDNGCLLEILTGEGKSCVIAMVAATYALLGRTVDIVTSSPVLSQRDAEEWREFFSMMKLEVGCNVDNTKEDTKCYECPIVYGTVETFARDILKTEFLIQDVRKGRKCDIVIVDEVDSMLIDQGVQCTYLSYDVPSVGLCHFDPVLALIGMHVNGLTTVISKKGFVFHAMEPACFSVTLSRLNNEIDYLQILRLAEEDEEVRDIKKGFTDEYLSKDFEGQERMLSSVDSFDFVVFARKILHLDFDIYSNIENFISGSIQRNDPSRISIITMDNGLASVVLLEDMIKDRLTQLITEGFLSVKNESKINLPIYLKDYCASRLQCWIDNAFLAKEMQPGREYIIDGDAIYPVDFKSTGVIEANKKWGDGLQQFLEMKHGLSRSPLSLITNFLSNIDFLERYGSNIVGVTGTLGNDVEKKFMSETFPVEFATIPTSKRRKLFVLDGEILKDEKAWLIRISEKVKSGVASQRAVLVICEDIATADEIHELISENGTKPYLLTKGGGYDGGHENKKLKPEDVVITTNLGARGTDFFTDDVVNKNGGLFVLVTFIPLNDRVEKQAFGRTGRRGATGSCQIIVTRETMPEWLRQCRTVEEAKIVRDSIEMHRLNNMTELNMMRSKQQLFREYCEIKLQFVKTSNCEPDDIEIQLELLDEIWAKWIQGVEARVLVMKHTDLMEELRRKITDCSDRAKRFESDNIYGILKFGGVRLMKGDFEGAAKFYDQVIRMDPAWSAFAHYNRAYCTIQMKGEGYIRRAINDFKTTLYILENYETSVWFSEIHANASTIQRTYMYGDDDDASKVREESSNRRSTQFYAMMELQLFQHIDAQISETIEKLETIETRKGEVTIVMRDILELMPGADCTTKKILEKYQQLGMLFIFNIDKKPTFCYMNEIMSLLEMLDAFIFMTFLADIILMTFCNLIAVTGRSMELKDTLNAFFNTEGIDVKSLLWISRSVQKAIINVIILSNLFRDVSSLIPITQNELESSYEKNEATSQLKHFIDSQTSYIYELLDSLCRWRRIFKHDFAILNHMTDIALDVLRKKIEQTIRDKMKPGQALYRELCCLYNSVTSTSSSDPQQYVDCIRDLAQLPVYSSQLSDADMCTSAFQNIAVKLMWIYDVFAIDSVASKRSEITDAAEKIEVGIVITQFSDLLCSTVNVSSPKSKADGYVYDEFHMLEATNKVLTSAWSYIIRGMLKNRIIRSVIPKIQMRTKEYFVQKCRYLYQYRKGHSKLIKQNRIQYKHNPWSDLSTRLREYNNEMKKSRGPHVQLKTDARMISKHLERNIIISDVNRESILTISSHDINNSIELIYYPPCPEYPEGHFDAYVDMKVVKATIEYADDDNMLYSAIRVAMGSHFSIREYFEEHPSEGGMLISSVNYASQLKRGRALLRLDTNPPYRKMNQCEHAGIDSPQLSSCIQHALKSENVGQLAKVLAEYESRSADVNSTEHATEITTSPVSRDACIVFLFSRSSIEAEIYRQLVVERINDGDITTALKLCCIGYQIPFCRDKIRSDRPISNAQIFIDNFDQMLTIESYEQERSKFLSICDEWYRVLEPRGLMNIEQRELLREWISTRQYANTEDPIVSLVIDKCSEPKKEEERKWQEAKKIREQEQEWKKARKMREEENKNDFKMRRKRMDYGEYVYS